jgi:predicted metal-dependent phosphoesterase TrpH
VKVDLHSHTCYSRDCLTRFEAIVRACQRRGIGCLAVTDHNVIDGALAFRDYAPFPVIVGEEIKTSEGEIIGLFLERWIARGLTPEETIAAIREQNGVVYVPHPFDKVRGSVIRRAALERVVGQVDVLEVFNSRVSLQRENDEARAFAEAHGLLMGGGSDSHTAYEIGRAYVEMEPFADRDQFLRHLRAGRVVGRLTTPAIHLLTALAKLRKRLAARRRRARPV